MTTDPFTEEQFEVAVSDLKFFVNKFKDKKVIVMIPVSYSICTICEDTHNINMKCTHMGLRVKFDDNTEGEHRFTIKSIAAIMAYYKYVHNFNINHCFLIYFINEDIKNRLLNVF